jgi:LmbE family N-acetylglucosaminyl deacetylase
VTIEGLAPVDVNEIYLFFSDRDNTWVDVTDTFDVKLAALRAHISQIREPEKLEARIREWASNDGKRIGVAAAESFRRLNLG